MIRNHSEFRIPRANVVSVRRRIPGTTSPSDHATVRLETGLIPFLETKFLNTEIPIGAGYHSRFSVPFGVAATAAYALIAPMEIHGVCWTGYDVEINWEAKAAIDDTLVAQAEVIAIDPGLACFELTCCSKSGTPLLRGKLRLRALRDGRSIQTPLLQRSDHVPESQPLLAKRSLIGRVDAPATLGLGCRGAISVTLCNHTGVVQTVAVSIQTPFGAGLSIDTGASEYQLQLPAKAVETIKWTIRADRPDEVNLARPWPLRIEARSGAEEEHVTVKISIPDPRPRRIFYVLTEDCETFDGGPLTGNYGAASALGNANNFMDPEDYRIQMIEKPNRMNHIAERYGARWTHFWCVPQRFAVDWAASHSRTGAWPRLASDLDQSVRQGSLSHEYAPHIHFDYEPDSRLAPQPRLLYDAETDGVLPNEYYDPITNPLHHFHDWDGSARGISYIKNLGDLNEIDSKAGSLKKSLTFLARLQMNRRYSIVARTGGLDFGAAAGDQLVSTEAYERNGLRANSDARFTATSPPPRKWAYWCDPKDRMREIEDLGTTRLVQLAISRETDFTDPQADKQWFSEAMETAPAAGIHLITAITHAMFMQGSPDPFRSLDGKSFSGLDQHLSWARTAYPELEFATASEAILEYLDYYAPQLEASVSAQLCAGDPDQGILEYGVRLLGAGIRVDEQHAAAVRIVAPAPFEARNCESLRVIADGELISETGSFDASRQPSLTATLTRRPIDIRLQVRLNAESVPLFADLLRSSEPLRFLDISEHDRQPLFQLRLPLRSHCPPDVLRLLTNPIAGSEEPLGRRVHPWGIFLIGAALTSALEAAGEAKPWRPESWSPSKIRLRWRREVSVDTDTYAECLESGEGFCQFRIRDQLGELLADGHAELQPSPEKQANSPSNGSADYVDENRKLADLSLQLADMKREHARILNAIGRYETAFQHRLGEYRNQRAWKVMLWLRGAYDMLRNKRWIYLLRWLTGSRRSLDSEELLFPRIAEFFEPPFDQK